MLIKGNLLEEADFHPIESCDFKELINTGIDSNIVIANAFQQQCLICKERTNDALVHLLPQLFKGKEQEHEPWACLAQVYIQHGYDVFNGINYFGVYDNEDSFVVTVHLVQPEFELIPDEPEAYITQDEAEKSYIEHVSGCLDKEAKTYNDAVQLMEKNWGDNNVRHFKVELCLKP